MENRIQNAQRGKRAGAALLLIVLALLFFARAGMAAAGTPAQPHTIPQPTAYLPLVSGGQAGMQAEPSSRVGVFYYPWYGTPAVNGEWIHWEKPLIQPPQDIDSDYYPELGPHSILDRGTLAQHYAWLRQARVGVIISSWWGRDSYEDKALPLLLDVAQEYGIQVAFHIEPYAGRTPQSVAADIAYLYAAYGAHPAFFRTTASSRWSADDRAKGIFFVWAIGGDEAKLVRDWQTVMDEIHGRPDGGLVIADLDQHTWPDGAHFDGLYNYASLTTDLSDTFTWAKGLPAGAWYVPSVIPGFSGRRDDQGNRYAPNQPGAGGVPLPYVSRQAGKTYNDQWQAALDAGVEPALVTITSFNEWHEGTQIEPAAVGVSNGKGFTYTEYSPLPPEGYLDLTRDWVWRFESLWPARGRAGGAGCLQGGRGAVYYVNIGDPKASDANDGAAPGWHAGSGPFKTIGHAMNVATAGDLICVRTGVYRESNLRFAHSGASGAEITLSAYPSPGGYETVVIDGPGGSGAVSGIHIGPGQSFITVWGVHIQNMPGAGILAEASTAHRSVALEDLVVRGNRTGVNLANVDGFALNRIEAFDNVEQGVRLQNVRNGVVQNVFAHHNATGIHLSGSSNNLLVHNEATENVVSGIALMASSDNNTLRQNVAANSQAEDGFTVAASGGNVLSDNEAYGNRKRGFQLTDRAHDNLLQKNQAHDNGVLGFALYVNAHNNTLCSNTAYGNVFHGFVFLAGAAHNSVEGNASFGNRRSGFYFESAVENVLRGNDAHENGFDGFTLFLGSANNTFQANSADRNGGWGFLADHESTNGALSAGNTATSNGAGAFGAIDFADVDFAAYTDISNP